MPHVVATVEQLAELVRGRVVGDGTIAIHSARPVDEAGPGDITYVESARYAKQLRTSPASAAIVGPHFKAMNGAGSEPSLSMIEVDDPITAFLAVRTHLVECGKPRWTGVHDRAYVAPDAKIGVGVAIYPLAYVGDQAAIGDGCTIHPGAVVGEGCRLGRDVILHPNVVLYPGVVIGDRAEVHAGTVLGSDGFKYHFVDGRHMKVPHTGRVEIGHDVEIGANCAIDRATFETTRIGEGTKIDNLVMIGHNNQIGNHNILCGQVGIAGSCKTGDYVILAGQAGIRDHIEIGDKATIGAKAGVHQNIQMGQSVIGSPAVPIREHHRIVQLIARLPEMYKNLRKLTTQVALLAVSPPTIQDEPDDPTGY